MNHSPQNHDPERGPGYEVTDARPRPLVFTAIAIFATTITVFFVVRGLLAVLEEKKPVDPQLVAEATQPVNREHNPFMDVYSQKTTLRRSEAETLSQYSYDRKTGAVAIPIDRAIDLIVERGVPKGKGPKTLVEVLAREEKKDEGKPAETKQDEAKKDEGKPAETKQDEAKKDEGKKDQ